MSKTALLFAGQGAQVVGMGKDLAEKYPSAKIWFDRANTAVGYDLAAICFNGPEPELTRTENAQPGIFLVSWVTFQLLKEQVPALKFDAAAGLSLGEFTALVAGGAMSFEDGLRAVRQRGRFMQEACDATRGGMAAIIGLDEAPTREVCADGRGRFGESELSRSTCDFRRSGQNRPSGRAGQGQRREARDFSAGRRCLSLATYGRRPTEAAGRTGKNQNFAPSGAGNFKRDRAAARPAQQYPGAAGRAGHVAGVVGEIHAHAAGPGFHAFY